MAWVACVLLAWAGPLGESPKAEAIVVRVPVSTAGEIDFKSLLEPLAKQFGARVKLPNDAISVPVTGLAGALTRTHLAEVLGPDVQIAVSNRELKLTVAPEAAQAARVAQLRKRIQDLASQLERDAKRRMQYGMHALKSYQPNDPKRPTVCLLHGINSSSGSFVHMVEPLEAAGFGLVAYDFPFNRDLDETVQEFAKDWHEFRQNCGETRPWIILTHSMGGLIARGYVEDLARYRRDVTDLCLVAPPNWGSAVAKTQVLLQLVQGIKSVNGGKAEALAQLSDGLGEAAEDMRPGSVFLKTLNGRPRQKGVKYHILAGDAGFLSRPARGQVETQFKTITKNAGVLGGLTRLAVPDLPAQLDELTDGRGDGCVAIRSTMLDGVDDFEVLHANHVELIRGPLLYPEPGPVACMPWLLKRVGPKPAVQVESAR